MSDVEKPEQKPERKRSGGGCLRTLLAMVVAFVLGVVALLAVGNMGLFSPFGLFSESHDSQVITAMERTQQVSLVSLGVQGIHEERQEREVFGQSIPGSGESVFLQYNFTAKLGVDGEQVKIRKTGDRAYTLTIPDFMFIGYEEPTFKIAVEDGGVLSWVTPDIDKVEVVNEILNDDARDQYLEDNRDLLEAQTVAFFDTMIHAIDPEITTKYVFAS